MPIVDYWEEKGLLSIWKGEITAEELYASNLKVLEDPRALEAHYQIVDTSEVLSIELDDVAVVDLAADDAAFSRILKDLKVAIVVKKPEIRKMAEKYINISWKLNSSWHFRIFETEKEAREWLQLDIHRNLA